MKALLVFVVLILGLFPTYADTKEEQKARIFWEKARSFYLQKNYKKALKWLEKADKQAHFMPSLLLKADIYKAEGNKSAWEDAIYQVIHKDSTCCIKYYEQLIEALVADERYQEAQEVVRLTAGAHENYQSVQEKISAIKTTKELLAQTDTNVRISIFRNQQIGSIYFPRLTIDSRSMYFTKRENLSSYRSSTGLVENIFVSHRNNRLWSEPQRITNNDQNNSGAFSISEDGKTIFFVHCTEGLSSSNNGIPAGCDLYFMQRINNQWSQPKRLPSPINTPYWESQPFFLGEVLYFVSNRPGGKGKMDIWQAKVKSYDVQGVPSFEKPKNLSNIINTEGNEFSPVMFYDNKTFFFASDHHPGLGGSDIFQSILNADTGFSTPRNIGLPINSKHNEHDLVFGISGQFALFSSDRISQGTPQIYIANFLSSPLTSIPYLHGVVLDKTTRKGIEAVVTIYELETQKNTYKSVVSSNDSTFMSILQTNKPYLLFVYKKGYMPYSKYFQIASTLPVNDTILLSSIERNASVILENIFFDINLATLKKESFLELQNLITFLKENPTIHIQIIGHTDNTGTVKRNKELSLERAIAVQKYLINTSIEEHRIVTLGLGSSSPIDDNDTEEGRSKNRRIEVKIIETGESNP